MRGADARALAGVRTVEVLVADELIPEGTPADELADLVRTETVPGQGRRSTAGSPTWPTLAGQVATVDLLPGEQLLAGRFAGPDDAAGGRARSPCPTGSQEVSVLLEPQRAVGGRLAAGDRSASSSRSTFEDGTAATRTPSCTACWSPRCRAPRRRSTRPPRATRRPRRPAPPLPSASLMVTLAVTARQAETVVFGIEHGTLWLSLEPEGADTSGTDVITQGNVYGKGFA